MTKILLVALPMLRYKQSLPGLGYRGAALAQREHEVSLYTVSADDVPVAGRTLQE